MRALVVHESLFGNTRMVAEAICAGLADARPDAEVRCLPATRVIGPPEVRVDDLDLLVVGCPTHAWGMSSVRSRTAQIAKDRREAPDRPHDPDAEGPGVRELIARMSVARAPVRAAAFDTRLASRFSGAPRNGWRGRCTGRARWSSAGPPASSSRAWPGRSRRASSTGPGRGAASSGPCWRPQRRTARCTPADRSRPLVPAPPPVRCAALHADVLEQRQQGADHDAGAADRRVAVR